MMRINVPKSNNNKTIYNISECILALCIILNCRSMWQTLDRIGELFNYGVILLTILSALGCVITREWGYRFKAKTFVCILFLGLYLLIYLLATWYNRVYFVLLVVPILALLLYYSECVNRQDRKPSIFDKIICITTIICTISFLFWLFGSVLHLIVPNQIVYSNWSGTEDLVKIRSYFGIHFEPQTLDAFRGFVNITRNTSIFAEAPMASVIFSLSFLMEVLLSDKPNMRRLLIIGITTFSTLSVTGITIVSAAIFAWFLKSKPKYTVIKVVKWTMIPLLTLLVLYIGISLVMERLGQRSGIVRIDDFKVGYNAWRSQPFFGAGYENNDFIKKFMSSWRSVNSGFSNSPMQVLAHGGIYIALLYIYALVKGGFYSIRSKEIKNIAFYLAFLVIFVVDLIPYQYISFLLLFYFSDSEHSKWSRRNKKKKIVCQKIVRVCFQNNLTA